MRVVLVVPRFPRLSETFIANKFVGLIDAGWDAYIACRQAAPGEWATLPALADRPELRGRVRAQWLHEPRWLAVLLWLPALLITLLRAPRAVGRYWRVVWPRFRWGAFKRLYLDATLIALAPDILHFEFGALAVGQTYLKEALGCALTVSFRGYDLNYAGIELPDFYWPLWQTVDAVHVLGMVLWRRAIDRGCPPDKPHALIPPAIDADAFRVMRFRLDGECDQLPASAERPLRLLSVGRLEWVKGYEYALRAAQLLAEEGVPFEYRIIGDGNYLEPLAFARYEMGLEEHVTFLGAQPQPEVAAQMAWADVFVQASVSEGFCNAVIEAQAMGLPVVASDAGGLPENVADGRTGFVVPRRDPAALAARIAELGRDPGLRRELGAAGRARVEECFSLPRQIAEFDRFYREVAARHAR